MPSGDIFHGLRRLREGTTPATDLRPLLIRLGMAPARHHPPPRACRLAPRPAKVAHGVFSWCPGPRGPALFASHRDDGPAPQGHPPRPSSSSPAPVSTFLAETGLKVHPPPSPRRPDWSVLVEICHRPLARTRRRFSKSFFADAFRATGSRATGVIRGLRGASGATSGTFARPSPEATALIGANLVPRHRAAAYGRIAGFHRRGGGGACRARAPCASTPSVISATGNLHYNLFPPEGRQGRRVRRICAKNPRPPRLRPSSSRAAARSAPEHGVRAALKTRRNRPLRRPRPAFGDARDQGPPSTPRGHHAPRRRPAAMSEARDVLLPRRDRTAGRATAAALASGGSTASPALVPPRPPTARACRRAPLSLMPRRPTRGALPEAVSAANPTVFSRGRVPAHPPSRRRLRWRPASRGPRQAPPPPTPGTPPPAAREAGRPARPSSPSPPPPRFKAPPSPPLTAPCSCPKASGPCPRSAPWSRPRYPQAALGRPEGGRAGFGKPFLVLR